MKGLIFRTMNITLTPAEIAGIVVALLGAVAGLTKVILNYRNANKALEIKLLEKQNEDSRIDLERSKVGTVIAGDMASLFTTIIDPISRRITILEAESVEKSKQITDLQNKIFELQHKIAEKDIELIKLTQDNCNQAELIKIQEIKIREQDARIRELENKIRTLQGEGKDG